MPKDCDESLEVGEVLLKRRRVEHRNQFEGDFAFGVLTIPAAVFGGCFKGS